MNEWLKLFLHEFKPHNHTGNPQKFDLESTITKKLQMQNTLTHTIYCPRF